MGVRELARLVPCNSGYVSNLRSGRKRPSSQVAARVDDLLAAGGRLAGLVSRPTPVRRLAITRWGDPLAAGASAAWSDLGPVSGAWAVAVAEPAAFRLGVNIGDLVMAAAHESSDRAAGDVGRLVSDASIDHLRGEVIRLARNFGGVSPLAFLVECRQGRDLAFQLVERTSRPSQSADLYLIIGQFCAMMAEASFDLAVWPAVIEQAHAASLYGEMIGYPSLQAWAVGMQAITAYWRGQAGEAVSLVEAGVSLAPPGSPRARLLSISARAWAHAGDAARARSALALADRDRDSIGDHGSDELHDVIGGQFAWGPARQAMSAASALLTIGDPFQAAVHAREAIRLQPEDQAGQRVGLLARADLAYAELAQDQVDAAEATLSPIWELEPAQRRLGLVERLGNISDMLARPRLARSEPVIGLVERIAVFTAEAAPKALLAGSASALPSSE